MPKGQVLTGQPPIVGYLYGDTLDDFGSRMEEGFCFRLDIQSASFDEQILLGSGVTNGTAFRIRLNADGVPHRVEMMLRDDDGKVLAGYADTSASRAKRLVCTADPRSNLLAFFELQPWVDDNLQIHYTKQDEPIRFSNLVHPFIMGGWNLDGQRKGRYVGRMENVARYNQCTEHQRHKNPVLSLALVFTNLSGGKLSKSSSHCILLSDTYSRSCFIV